MIKLKDFAQEQGVTDRQIQRLLKKYAEELNGLYQRKGPNGTWLTDDACEILRGKMRQAPTAVFTPDPQVAELKRELEEAKAAAKDLWEQMKQKEKSMALLIEQNQQLSLKAASVERLEATNESQEAQISRLSDDNGALRVKIAESEEKGLKANSEAFKAKRYALELETYVKLPKIVQLFIKRPALKNLEEETSDVEEREANEDENRKTY